MFPERRSTAVEQLSCLQLEGGRCSHSSVETEQLLQPDIAVHQSIIVPKAYLQDDSEGSQLRRDWGLVICKKHLNDTSIADRTIQNFIHQCPSCQAMSQLRYSPLHLRLILSLRSDSPGSHRATTTDAHGNKFILVLIDASSRWVELFPTKTTTALESASCMLQHLAALYT